MRKTYLTDENVPLPTVKALQEIGVAIRSIFDIDRGMDDKDILSYAFECDYIILTFDKDFGELIFEKKQFQKELFSAGFLPNLLNLLLPSFLGC